MAGNKNRSYKKGAPHRDFRKFIIVAEGEREDGYFDYFEGKSKRVTVEIVEREGGKSAAKYLIQRLEDYNSQFGIEPEDFVWFVLDVDRWPRDTIDDVIVFCAKIENYNVSISNPCFEVWLHYHTLKAIPKELDSAAKLKANLPLIVKGGYNTEKFISLIESAIFNAYKADKDRKHDFPDVNISKVYSLASKLLAFLGKNWRD